MSKIVTATIKNHTGEEDFLDITQVSALMIPSSYVEVASGEGKTKTITSTISYKESSDELTIKSEADNIVAISVLDQIEFVNALSDNAHNKKAVFDKIEYVEKHIESNKKQIVEKLGENGTLFTNIKYVGKMVILHDTDPIGYFEAVTIRDGVIHLQTGSVVADLRTVEYDRILLEIDNKVYDVKGFVLEDSVNISFKTSEIKQLEKEVEYKKMDMVKDMNSKESYEYEETWEEDVNKIISMAIGDEECDIDDFDDLF